MATIKRFEELEVWQMAMQLVTRIYNATNNGDFAKDFSLKDQIRRSAISIPSNISEGFERDSIRQFIYFLHTAKGSCGELRTQLRIAEKLNYVNDKESSELAEECIAVSRQLAGFIGYLKTKNLQNV